jgi:hypothetical protein
MSSGELIPIVLILVALVFLMAGAGNRGIKAGGSILVVIAGALVVALLWGLVLRRTL